MLQIPKLDFAPIVEIVRRRKWWIILPLLVTLSGGAFYVYVTPKTYRASTMILVESQRVPTSYVKPTVTETLQSRLHTISQQIHSRTNIEKIIKEFGLAPQPADKNGPVARIKRKIRSWLHIADGSVRKKASTLDLVENIRHRIEVSIRARNRAFQISFEWHDPKVAADVANAIASQFIEQNLQVREEMAMGTTRFLDSEVERLRQELQSKEKALEAFKKANMGMLPEQLESNLTILNQLKDELNNLEQRLATEKQQAAMLKNQLALAGGPMVNIGWDSAGEMGNVGDSPALMDLEARLKELKTKYTDKHPDVVALKRRIERLQREEKNAAAEKDTAGLESMQGQGGLQEDALLKTQLEGFKQRVADYEQQIRKVRQQIKVYQDRVENTSKVELQLRNLERDYTTVNKRYQDLLSKKLNAQMAEELEKRQKGEQFKVIDAAVPPDKPFRPDLTVVAMMSLMLGLGLGGGLAFLRESLDPAFYTPEDIEAYLPGASVVVSLPWDDEISKAD